MNHDSFMALLCVTDLATRRPRASLSLLGPVSITLADDAMRLQRLNDELQQCQARSLGVVTLVGCWWGLGLGVFFLESTLLERKGGLCIRVTTMQFQRTK